MSEAKLGRELTALKMLIEGLTAREKQRQNELTKALVQQRREPPSTVVIKPTAESREWMVPRPSETYLPKLGSEARPHGHDKKVRRRRGRKWKRERKTG